MVQRIIDVTKNKDGKKLAPNKSAQAKDIVVAEWRATKREVVRVVLRDFKGLKLLDIRRWYRDAEGKLCPGKGLSCRPWDVKPLRKALREAERLLSDCT
jgi:transcriptional coactivator p15 (PC4)